MVIDFRYNITVCLAAKFHENHFFMSYYVLHPWQNIIFSCEMKQVPLKQVLFGTQNWLKVSVKVTFLYENGMSFAVTYKEIIAIYFFM